MLRLRPVLKDYIWGGKALGPLYGRDNGGGRIAESWEVSVHPDGESTCAEGGTLAAFLKDHPAAVDGRGAPFPVLIKYIDAAQNLSVQVHPADDFARRVENDNGKTEMWYIVAASEGAGIYCGFREDTDKDAFLRMVREGTVQNCLNFIPVKAGDCYLIKAGTVHAIGAGCIICEVQQSSNVTYRVFDYNRPGADGKPRPLHLDKAMQVINFRKFKDETGRGESAPVGSGSFLRTLTDCGIFRCRELSLGGSYGEKNGRSFTAVNVLSGEGSICGQPFRAGDSFFIPCGEEFALTGKGLILLTDEGSRKED